MVGLIQHKYNNATESSLDLRMVRDLRIWLHFYTRPILAGQSPVYLPILLSKLDGRIGLVGKIESSETPLLTISNQSGRVISTEDVGVVNEGNFLSAIALYMSDEPRSKPNPVSSYFLQPP